MAAMFCLVGVGFAKLGSSLPWLMLVVVIAAGGLIVDGGFIMSPIAGAGPVPDGWVDANMKGIVEGRTRKALTRAGADGAGVYGDDDTNAADEVVGLIIGNMKGGTMPEESAMEVFLSL